MKKNHTPLRCCLDALKSEVSLNKFLGVEFRIESYQLNDLMQLVRLGCNPNETDSAGKPLLQYLLEASELVLADELLEIIKSREAANIATEKATPTRLQFINQMQQPETKAVIAEKQHTHHHHHHKASHRK